MERLLRFAVEHDRVIRLMFMRDGRLFQVNAHIVSYDDKQVSFVTTRSPRTCIPLENEKSRRCYSLCGSRVEARI